MKSCGELGTVKYEQVATREVQLRPQFGLRDAALAMEHLGEALRLGADVLCDRANRQCIRDGHGDLRQEHVLLLASPVMIDCLEFNPKLRQVDPFDELAYLGLECDMLGASWIGPRLIARVASALLDASTRLACPFTPRTGLWCAPACPWRICLTQGHVHRTSEPRWPHRQPPDSHC